MLPEGKTIYSKRFPRPDFEAMYREAERELTAGKKTALQSKWKDCVREWEQCCGYVPREDKLEGLPRFLDLARQLSQEHKIDMDIQQFDHSVSAELYLYDSAYRGAAKDLFAELLKLSDGVSFCQNTEPPFDLTLFLSYDTHEYRPGPKAE